MRLAAALSRSSDARSFAACFAATVVLAAGLLAALTLLSLIHI